MESVEKGVGKEVRRLAANAVNMAVKAAAKGGAGARHMPMIPMPSQPKPAGEPQMAGAGAGWGAGGAGGWRTSLSLPPSAASSSVGHRSLGWLHAWFIVVVLVGMGVGVVMCRRRCWFSDALSPKLNGVRRIDSVYVSPSPPH
jgi:hypothetical protein